MSPSPTAISVLIFVGLSMPLSPARCRSKP
nr:MAG TPA: hypothetical protein [Caudoviricetes sp.]